jgi:hypothetical protein
MAKERFRATLQPSGRGGGHLVEVPAPVVATLGGKGRTPVNAAFNGVPYRGSIVTMGDAFVLGVTKAIMSQAGVGSGDELEVAVELDTEERTIAAPPDLEDALAKAGKARDRWERLSYSHKREYVQAIEEARKPETRARRIAQAVESLRRTDPGGR